jgi:hypothetical protein
MLKNMTGENFKTKFEFDKFKVAARARNVSSLKCTGAIFMRNSMSNGKVSPNKAIQFHTRAYRTVQAEEKWKANKKRSRCCYRFFDWRTDLPIGTRYTGISCSISCFFLFPSCESEALISYFHIGLLVRFKSPCNPPCLLT